MKLGVLGPKGSYSDLAASEYTYKKVYFDDIKSVIKAVSEGLISKGLVPIENSLHGTVVEALDNIKKYDIFVEDSIILPIHHCIAGLSKEVNARIILSHPQALAQCRGYVEKNYSSARLEKTVSTSNGFKKIKEEGLKDAVAIGSKAAAELFNLEIIDECIEDEGSNKTVFFLLSKGHVLNNNAKKTFIAVSPGRDRPGLLYTLLGFFNNEGINLTKIESRPSRKELGHYIFYIEFEGNSESSKVKRVLNGVRENIGNVNVLGCYSQKEILT